MLRRSAGHGRRRENSGTSAKSWKTNGKPARNVRTAAAQSYKGPLDESGGRRRGEKGTLDGRMLALCCEDEDELEVVGGQLPSSSSTAWRR